jgi:hypothetical protein
MNWGISRLIKYIYIPIYIIRYGIFPLYWRRFICIEMRIRKLDRRMKNRLVSLTLNRRINPSRRILYYRRMTSLEYIIP